MVVLHVPASNSTSVPKRPANQAGLAAILPPPPLAPALFYEVSIPVSEP